MLAFLVISYTWTGSLLFMGWATYQITIAEGKQSRRVEVLKIPFYTLYGFFWPIYLPILIWKLVASWVREG